MLRTLAIISQQFISVEATIESRPSSTQIYPFNHVAGSFGLTRVIFEAPSPTPGRTAHEV